MKSREIRSEADSYRQERKERIKKDQGKKTKGSGKATKVLGKVLAVVLCVLIAGGGIWFLADFFGWPQKLVTVATVKVGDKEVKVNAAEFNFYYTSAFMTAVNTSYQYSQYGYNMGYDYNKTPEEQKTKDSDGNEITYAEYFKQQALDTIEQARYCNAKAEELGIELEAHELNEVEETMDSIRTRAASNNYSPSAYIISNYGKGLNAHLFEKYLKEQLMIERYDEYLQDSYADAVTTEDIQSTYDENPNDYNVVDLRVYGFELPSDSSTESDTETTEEYTAEEQRERANEMISRVTDEASFRTLCLEYCAEDEYEDFSGESDASLAKAMSYDTIKSSMSEDDAKWAFDSARKTGDTAVWETSSYVYAVFVVKPAYRNDESYVSVRHLLVQFPDEEEQETATTTPTEPATDEKGATVPVTEPEVTDPVTHLDDGVAYEGKKHDKTKEETVYKETPKTNDDAKRIAEGYLERFNKTDKSEAEFAKLANLYSDDTSSTSAGNGEGGLIENMKRGQYVAPFEAWAFDEARKPGDVEIVETTYGYHLIYFVGRKDEPAWQTDIRNEKASKKLEDEADQLKAEYNESLTEKEKPLNWAYKKSLKHVSSLRFS